MHKVVLHRDTPNGPDWSEKTIVTVPSFRACSQRLGDFLRQAHNSHGLALIPDACTWPKLADPDAMTVSLSRKPFLSAFGSDVRVVLQTFLRSQI